MDDEHHTRRIQKWGGWESPAMLGRYDDSRRDFGGEASIALAASV